MSTPTKPGWYWCKIDGCNWQPVELHEDGYAYPATEDRGYDAGEYEKWEWGERIPDSDTLKAMRKFIRIKPGENQIEAVCPYCGVPWHTPECPWLLAQEKE